MKLPGYRFRGGLHPETATVTNALAAAGVKAPHNGKAFSEAMIFGIAGGLGAGYILWEFERWNAAIPVFGFQNNWQYPVKFMNALGDRLGAAVTIRETGGAKKAAADLDDALSAGKPAICWVDQGHLPYFNLPEDHTGCFGHVISVVGLDAEADRVIVDDRSKKPYHLSGEELAAARGRIPSYKNRLMTVGVPKKVNLKKAVEVGLKDCAEHLAKPSDSFSLPVLRKWARTMTDAKHKKGWPRVFADPVGLYSTLQSIYEAVEPGVGSGGGNLRKLYADFLREAASVTGRKPLTEVAALYRKAARQWSGLAKEALPDDHEVLAKTRERLDQRAELMRKQGGTAEAELAALGKEINRDYARYNRRFPGDKKAALSMFERLQGHLEGIYAVEVETNQALRDAL